LASFFNLAAASPGRQRALRNLVGAHVLIAGLAVVALAGRSNAAMIAGNVLLVLGIVEGALLIGWRLAQLPKSQALEFLLVSPLRPPRVFFAEALVGMARLALVTFSGLPVVILMALAGVIGRAAGGAGGVSAFVEEHECNPCGGMEVYMENRPGVAWPRFLGVQLLGAGLALVLLARSAFRLAGHFHDRHYRPIADDSGRTRPPVGERPLSWWAVKRVSEYSGRVNLWLAGGLGLLYAPHTVAG